MEHNIEKSYKTEERYCAFIDLKDTSHLLMTKEEQNKVYDGYNIVDETQNPIKKIEIRSGSDNLNAHIKIEQVSIDEIEAQSEQEMMINEIYIKHEEIQIKHEVSSFESSLPVSTSNGFMVECVDPIKNARKMSISVPNSTATNIRCKSCDKEIKGGPSLTSSRLFSQEKCTNDLQTNKCEACRENPSKKYKCNMCPYCTDDRSNFSRHFLKHKDRSEVKMHKCTYCDFETKYELNLKSHVVKHQEPSEIEMFRCQFCTYQSKYKRGLANHLLSHKDPSEVEMFRCNMCMYKSKYKYLLRKHMLIHRHPSEVQIFKCQLCEFGTKYKRDLKVHMLVHKDPSEVEIFRCESCGFGTKYKSGLKIHMLLHKSPSEINMFSCELCNYSTKHKSSLKRHMLRDKHPLKVEMYSSD